MKKIIILVIVLLLIFAYFNSPKYLISQQQPITSIKIEDLGGPRVIVNEDEINLVIDALKLNKWRKKHIWRIKLAPNFYVVINNDMIIGLFDGDDYAKLEGNKGGYYKIPKGINLEIRKIIENID